MSESVKTIGDMTVKVVKGSGCLLQNNLISSNDAEMDRRATAAVQSAIDRARICKKPIAGYDIATKRAFVEYADGSKKYVD